MTLTREQIRELKSLSRKDAFVHGLNGETFHALCNLAMSALSARAEPPLRQEMDEQDGSDAAKALAQPDGLSWNELKQKHGLESPSPIQGWQHGGARCDFCDNGIMPEWAFCPYCSRILNSGIAAQRCEDSQRGLSATREAVLNDALALVQTAKSEAIRLREAASLSDERVRWATCATEINHIENGIRALKAAGSGEDT